MMFTREQPASQPVIQLRIGVSSRNENALPRAAIRVVPQHCDPVGGILALNADDCRKSPRADVRELNQANPRHGPALVQFGTKLRRQ